jgi:hypothetical protein
MRPVTEGTIQQTNSGSIPYKPLAGIAQQRIETFNFNPNWLHRFIWVTTRNPVFNAQVTSYNFSKIKMTSSIGIEREIVLSF